MDWNSSIIPAMSYSIERLNQLTARQAKFSSLLERRNTQIEGLLSAEYSQDSQFRLDRAIPSRDRVEARLVALGRAIAAKRYEIDEGIDVFSSSQGHFQPEARPDLNLIPTPPYIPSS